MAFIQASELLRINPNLRNSTIQILNSMNLFIYYDSLIKLNINLNYLHKFAHMIYNNRNLNKVVFNPRFLCVGDVWKTNFNTYRNTTNSRILNNNIEIYSAALICLMFSTHQRYQTQTPFILVDSNGNLTISNTWIINNNKTYKPKSIKINLN